MDGAPAVNADADRGTSPGMKGWLAGSALVAGLVVAGLVLARLGGEPDGRAGGDEGRDDDPRPYEERVGSRFGPVPADPLALPTFEAVPLPRVPGGMAIWGATGRDSRGHIWAGVSAVDTKQGDPVRTPSAHLLEYDPTSGEVADRGDALGQLRRLGLLTKDNERQEKIHSRIIQASDGRLYFASSSEDGADLSGTRGPIWASHLWRLDPAAPEHWEHLASAPEALIAVAGSGRDIFALGWFGHVLYHYDIRTGRFDGVRVGAASGHISRHLLADHRGHAYVPRVAFTTDSPSRMVVGLVEFDRDLREVGSSAIENDHYIDTTPQASHGIAAYQYMADQSICFVTHPGYLYRVRPRDDGPAELASLGRIHPDAARPIESLFTPDGRRYLAGVSQWEAAGDTHYDWLVHDLETGRSVALPMIDGIRNLPDDRPGVALAPALSLRGVTFYGSIARDDGGAAYIVGRRFYEPLLVRIGWAAEPAPFPILARGAPGDRPGEPAAPSPESTAAETAAMAAPATEPAAAPSPAPRAPRPGSREERIAFHRDLQDLLDDLGPRAGPAIRELGKKQFKPIPPAARAAVERAAARLSRAARIRYYRTSGIPEATILDDLAGLESRMIGGRNAARDQDEALIRAARSLLAVPPP